MAYFAELIEKEILSLKNVFEIRRQGFMTAIELTQNPGNFSPYDANERIGIKITKEARSRSAIIRPLGNAMVLMPALAMPKDKLEQLVQIAKESIEAVCGK